MTTQRRGAATGRQPTGRALGAGVAACAMIAFATANAAARAQEETMPAPPLIRTTLGGQVSGLDGEVQTFKGIPYAAPPIGPLRWRPPQPVEAWSGVRPATEFGADCYGAARLRKGSLAPAVSEDCLYLNIWAPRGAANRRLPVMVWVYGGSFVGGSSAMTFYDGSVLARRGVIVVTFNYRTHVLGFLAHPELTRESPDGASGNYGLLDILAALRWVKGNIAGFGGDPDRVTVFGESAGASAIGLLLTSPLSTDLVDGAILESPGLARPLATLPEAEAAGQKLGNLQQLRAMEPQVLMAHADAAIKPSRDLRKPRPVGPIIDGRVLPRSDTEAIAEGRLQPVPVIVGSNAEEGRLFVERLPVDTVSAYQAYLSEQFPEKASDMARCYPAAADGDVKPALARLFGDNQFIHGIDAFSAALARRDAPVWRYRFVGNAGADRPVATHGDELPFVFGNFEPNALGMFPWLKSGATEADRRLAREMVTAWTSFAKRGDPNADALAKWPAYRPGGPIMTFGPGGAMRVRKAARDGVTAGQGDCGNPG